MREMNVQSGLAQQRRLCREFAHIRAIEDNIARIATWPVPYAKFFLSFIHFSPIALPIC